MEQNDVTLTLCKFNASCLLAMHAMRSAGNHAFRRSAPKAVIGGDSKRVTKRFGRQINEFSEIV